MSLSYKIISKLVDTIKSNIFQNKDSTSTSAEKNNDNTDADSDDPNVIDLQKTFSSANIDVTQIIKDILNLHKEFPNNILYSKDGHKYNELEFFQSNLDSNVNSKNACLFDKLNRTSTQLGKTLLQSIVLQPTNDIKNILKYRQQQASIFTTHPKLKEIRTILSECAKLEKDVLFMQMADTAEMEEVYKVIFFQFLPLKKLNYNETFLKLFYYFIIIFSPAYGAIAPFVFMFAPYIFMRYVLKVPLPFETFWTVLKKLIMGGTGFFTNLHKIINSDIGKVAENMMAGASGAGGSAGATGFSFKNAIISIIKWVVAFMNTTAGTYVYLGFISITYLYGIYNSIQSSITHNKIINMFHSRLNIISKWLKCAVKCYTMKLGFESPEIAHCFIEIKALLQNPTIQNLLNDTCFDSEPGVFSNKGMIIKTFKEFLDLKAMIQPFCKYMAHIDVWCGIGKWLEESKMSGVGSVGSVGGCESSGGSICSFITDSKTPIVKGTALWNICCDKPIYNDVKLGYEKEAEKEAVKDSKPDRNTDTFNNLLITGPNGSGKSTYIKSVIECILLGQTIGVVPAKEFSFTPFVNIATYLNIPDCQGKESLFQAEMNRCYQQLQMLNTAEEKGDFSFNIMDEIFVSTNYQEGMSGAYAIIKKMCNLNKCLNIITTHFDVLAGMDEVKVDKQYFDIEIDENDNIISDYKIKSGVSKKHLALKLLKKKGFDASIIADAEYLYEKLQGFDSKKKELKDEKDVVVVVEDMIEDVIVVEKGSIDGEVVEEDIIVEKEKEETINLDDNDIDIELELDTTNI